MTYQYITTKFTACFSIKDKVSEELNLFLHEVVFNSFVGKNL